MRETKKESWENPNSPSVFVIMSFKYIVWKKKNVSKIQYWKGVSDKNYESS